MKKIFVLMGVLLFCLAFSVGIAGCENNKQYVVTFEVESTEKGTIEGKTVQTLYKLENSEEVTAVPQAYRRRCRK